MKTASVSSLRSRRVCRVILLIFLPLIVSVAAARAMHTPGHGNAPTRLVNASNWDHGILILGEQEKILIAETDSALPNHPGGRTTPGEFLVVSHAPSPITAAGIVPGIGILDLSPQRNAVAFSLGDARADKSMVDSGLVSSQLIFAVALLSSLLLIEVRHRGHVSILRRVDKLLTATGQGVSGAVSMGRRVFRHRGSLARLTCARNGVAENFDRDNAEQKRAEACPRCHHKRISALYKLDRMLLSQPDSRSVTDTLLEVLTEDFPKSAITIRLLNHTTRRLETVACSIAKEVEWMAEIDEGSSQFARLVIEDRRAILIRNVQARLQPPYAELFRHHGWDSYFGIPLLARGHIVGVVAIYTPAHREFGGDEVEYLSTLVSQSALAIHNSQLYSQTLEQTAQLRKANAALERSNRVKSEFLSVMSHEFKTPLNVIMGYAGMMQDGFLGPITEEQQQGLEEVMRGSDNLMALVMSMLHAASIETEAVELKREDVGLTDLLGDLRSEFRVPQGKRIDLVWDYPADLPIVKTDGEKLKCVLSNLIDNAVKFTERGQVIISSKNLPEPGMVEFRIADTGIGIPENAVAHVFEQFEQLDSSITRTYDGAGLGLYIAKKFSELLGGQISVSTELGKGSTFTLTLPMAA